MGHFLEGIVSSKKQLIKQQSISNDKLYNKPLSPKKMMTEIEKQPN